MTTAAPIAAPAVQVSYDFGLCSFHVAPDREAAGRETARLAAAALERVQAAADAWRKGPAVAEVVRLTAQVNGIRRDLNAALAALTAADHAARALLSKGQDPARHEKESAAHQHEHKVLLARLRHVGGLLEAARKAAEKAADHAVKAAWQGELARLQEARRAALQKALAALAPLAAEVLGIDQADAGMLDPLSGGVPAEWLALVQL